MGKFLDFYIIFVVCILIDILTYPDKVQAAILSLMFGAGYGIYRGKQNGKPK